MLPMLQIGPLAVQTPGLVLLAGLWIGLTLAERHAHRRGVEANHVYNLAFLALVVGIIGGRLLYAAQYPQAFMANPISLISLNPGLFDLTAGAGAGLIAALIYGNRRKLPFWSTLDALTPLFAVLMIASALANLASGAAFGTPSELPWAVELWGALRHPVQVYEALGALLIFIIVWPARDGTWFQRPGIRFLTFVALTAAARLFFEFFRGDSFLLPYGLRTAQLAAWVVLALALAGIRKLMPSEAAGVHKEASTS
jgi:phosphatidylglycerol---prolipoprotein diacylglyceryl transferase